MLVADLENLVSAAPEEVRNYALYLACPDTVAADNADEQTAIIGDVVLSTEQSEARLYPPFAKKVTDEAQCYTLADLLSALTNDADYQPDLRLVAELPLVREDSVTYETSLVPIVEMHIGPEAGEVWLLLAAPSDFPANSLPA
jgi:hypothetical protein